MPYTSPATVVTGTTIASTWGNAVKAATDYLANPPSCRVTKASAQTLATGTNTAITFDTERYDTDSMHSTSSNTSRITFTTAGLYIVGGSVEFASSGTGSYRQLGVRLNGATFIAWALQAPASLVNKLTVATTYKFAAGDYIELLAEHNHGANLDISKVGNYSPEFYATWIGLG